MAEKKKASRAEKPASSGKQTSSHSAASRGQAAEFRVNYLIHDVSRLRRTLFDQEMRPYGVTHVQWTTLAQLSRSSTGSMSQNELARLLGVGKVAISRVIDRLEKSGLVSRGFDENDRRVNLVAITPAATTILNKMTEVSRKVNRKLLEGISAEQLVAMELALARIKENARAQLSDDAASDDERTNGAD